MASITIFCVGLDAVNARTLFLEIAPAEVIVILDLRFSGVEGTGDSSGKKESSSTLIGILKLN